MLRKFNDLEDGQQKCCVVCCSVTTLVILVASITMFALSFGYLDPHEMGVHYDGVALKIEEKPFDNGRYFLGLGHKFLKYPRKLEYMEFSGGCCSIFAWSRDGQEIDIDVGFYYRLSFDHLIDVYFNHEQDYSVVVRDIAANALRDVAVKYPMTDFYKKRAQINQEMATVFSTRLYDAIPGTNVTRFNIMELTMPDAFSEAVVDTIIKAQEKITLELQRQSSVIRQNIQSVNAEADARIVKINAAAAASAALIVKQAQADAFRSFRESWGNELFNVSQALAFTEQQQGASFVPYSLPLLQYMYMDVVRGDISSSTLAVNFPSALLNV